MSSIDKKLIIKEFAKEYDLPETYVGEKLENLMKSFKKQKPNMEQAIKLKEYIDEFLNKLIIYESANEEFTYVIKANTIYFDSGNYVVSGPCIEFAIFDDSKTINFLEEDVKFLHPEMNFEVIDEAELLDMINEMKDTIEYNVKNTMFA